MNNESAVRLHKERPGSLITASYLQDTPESAAAYLRSQRYVPGGTSRQAGYWEPYPVTLTRGEGSYVWDLDGRRYIDLINNYTSMLHGHAYPPIVEAVEKQIRQGTGWVANCPPHIELAEQIVERVASVKKIRFTNSGTEANNLALTIARTVTGRQKILMARYGYHGSLMEFEVGSFGHEGPLTRLARYNNLADFEAVLDEEGDEIAAVFLEPIQGFAGIVVGETAFVEGVMAATRKAGALFILDEVITLRLGFGAYQETYGVEPDLTSFGKIIGGGFPVGAVGGSEELMRTLEPGDTKVFHSGTFNANPVTMTAGNVAMREFTSKHIVEMEKLALRLKKGLEDAAQSAGLAFLVRHEGSLLNIYFTDTLPESTVERNDMKEMSLFHLAAMNHGLFIAPRGMLALSTVMTNETIDDAIAHAAAAMQDVSREIE